MCRSIYQSCLHFMACTKACFCSSQQLHALPHQGSRHTGLQGQSHAHSECWETSRQIGLCVLHRCRCASSSHVLYAALHAPECCLHAPADAQAKATTFFGSPGCLSRGAQLQLQQPARAMNTHPCWCATDLLKSGPGEDKYMDCPVSRPRKLASAAA